MNESTDIFSCCQLLTMVRYVKDKTVKKEFLFCQALQTTATAKDLFDLVKEFFKYYNIDISLIGSICTDGTSSMLGNCLGFAAFLKKEVPTLKVIHCMIHEQVLASKSMPESMKNVFDTCIKMINFIRKHDTNHKIFQLFCDETSNEHCIWLYHTNMQLVSRSRVMTRFFELQDTIKLFLQYKNSDFVGSLENNKFIQHVAYIVDVMYHLNELNLSLQEQQINVITTCKKLKAFKLKLSLWSSGIAKDNLANLPSLNRITKNCLLHNVKHDIIAHLMMLDNSFDGYFSANELNAALQWIINPFLFDLTTLSDDDNLKEDLIEIKSC